MSSDPFCFLETREAMSGRIKFESVEQTVFVTCGLEVANFVEQLGSRGEDTAALLRELDPPLREIIESRADTIMMLRFDPGAGRMYLHLSQPDDDDASIKQAEAFAYANDHPVLALYPALVRDEIVTEGAACLATRH